MTGGIFAAGFETVFVGRERIRDVGGKGVHDFNFVYNWLVMPPRLKVAGDHYIKGFRKFDAATLLALEVLAVKEGFLDYGWTFSDSQGEHGCDGLNEVLDSVLWRTVTHFSFHARRQGRQDFRPIDDYAILYIFEYLGHDAMLVKWEGPSSDREQVERLSAKVIDVLEACPKVKSPNRRFESIEALPAGHAPAPIDELGAIPETESVIRRAWWDLRRPPESIIDWAILTAFVTAFAGIIVALVIALVI